MARRIEDVDQGVAPLKHTEGLAIAAEPSRTPRNIRYWRNSRLQVPGRLNQRLGVPQGSLVLREAVRIRQKTSGKGSFSPRAFQQVDGSAGRRASWTIEGRFSRARRVFVYAGQQR